MSSLAGAVVWAVVPFAPEPPFRIYAGEERPPLVVPEPGKIIDAARRGADSEFSFIVPGKARPILILSDTRDERLGELAALRLLSFSKLTPGEQELVRTERDPTLFHLKPADFPKLPEENAAMIAGLVRVHHKAIDGREVLGRLKVNELRAVHERVAKHYRLDLHNLIMEQIRLLGERQRRR